VTAEEPDRLLDAAARLLDVVETEPFTTALDQEEGGTPAPTIGTVVAAAVQRIGERARSQGVDEELVAAPTYTVWLAAEGVVNRALAATAAQN
jgi:hypothetical protein